MKSGILINTISGAGKVMIFEKPHTASKVLGLVDNNTKCEVLEGPMPTEDHYPGILLYRIKVNGKIAYANVKYVKVKK